MPRQLLLAPFGSARGAERLLALALAEAEPRDILYLCPSPRRLRLVQADLLKAADRPAIVPPRFLSLGQLSRDLHERYGTRRRLPPELKPLLFQRILTESPSASRTGTIGNSKLEIGDSPDSPSPVSHSPSVGYAAAVARFASDIRRYVAKPDRPGLADRFKALLAGFEKPLARCLDSLSALERYEKELERLGWDDDEGIMAEAATLALEHESCRVLVLDSFVAPNRLEADLIRGLVNRAQTTLVLGYGGDPADPDYAQPARFASFIQSLGGFDVERLPEPARRQEPLFFQYPDIEEELSAVCRDYLTQGSPAGTVVCLPRLNDCAHLVSRVFERYEIPATVFPSTDLATSPPVVAVLELLTSLDSGYERIATCAALGSPFLPGLLRLDDKESPESRARAAAALNHYSRRGRIIKEKKNWDHILDRVAASEDGHLDDSEAEFLRDLERRVRKAIGLVEKMLEPADTLGRQARRLKQFLEAVDFCKNLVSDEPHADELLEDRKALYDTLDALAEFEQEFGARPEPRARFIKVLTYLIGLAERAAEPAPAGVLVLDTAETLGLNPARLYFCGLTDSRLPGAYSPDPIMPDRVRRELDMPDIDWHRDWQRFHFRRTLESSLSAPFLSFHDSSQGRPVLPTPFMSLKPAKPEPNRVLLSRAEEQIARGRAKGELLEDSIRPVDFSQDREVVKALAERFGPERPISITRLERYRRCPYAFYIDNVLGIETPEEPLYDVDARQWGLVVHRVMEKLYAQGPVRPDKLRDAALKALDATLAETDLPGFWAEVTRRVFDNLLPELVRVETELREGGYEPALPERMLRHQLADDIALQGRFDRVDVARDRFRVLDYKTGQPGNANPKAVLDGTHLQLPLYAWLYGQEAGAQPDNFGIYALREPGVIWFAGRKYTVEELVKAALENAIVVVKQVRAGRFPPEPGDERACDYCGLDHTCGRTKGAV